MHEIPRIVKLTESERSVVDARAGGGDRDVRRGKGALVFNGDRVSV